MLELLSLSIANFRGIREGHIQGLADVNLLIGRNNSGKTAVIEAISRLSGGVGVQEDLLGRNVNAFWQQARGGASSIELMWYRQDKSKDILFKGSIGEARSPGAVEEVTLQIGKNNALRPHRQQRPGTSDPNRTAAFFQDMVVLRPRDAFDSTIEQRFWPAILSTRKDKQLTRALNNVFALNAEAFQIVPNAGRGAGKEHLSGESYQMIPDSQLVVLFDDYSLPLDAQGDGTRAAMRILLVLTMMQKTLLLLEEPECHQHPGSLERFSKALCGLAHDQEVQLVISTHSRECVGSFLRASQAVGSTAAVFHLSLSAGKQDARRLDPEAVETLQSTGVDVRFLDLYG